MPTNPITRPAEAARVASVRPTDPVEVILRPCSVSQEEAAHRTATLLRTMLGHVASHARQGIPYALAFNLSAIQESIDLTAPTAGGQD